MGMTMPTRQQIEADARAPYAVAILKLGRENDALRIIVRDLLAIVNGATLDLIGEHQGSAKMAIAFATVADARFLLGDPQGYSVRPDQLPDLPPIRTEISL